jgi:hypothetical protein
MSRFRSYQQWVFIAASIWLCASLLGAYGHYCLDGKEPSVSVHMGVDQKAHPIDDLHMDMDVELSKVAPLKIVKIDLPLLVTALVLLLIIASKSAEFFYQTPQTHSFFRICPPLRAPPAPL